MRSDVDILFWPASLSSVGLTVYLTNSSTTSFALDRPTHTAVSLLTSISFVFFLASKYLSTPKRHARTLSLKNDDAIHQSSTTQHASSIGLLYKLTGAYSSYERTPVSLVLLVVLLLVRVAICRTILRYSQCTTTTLTPLIPLLVAVLDMVMIQSSAKSASVSSSHKKDDGGRLVGDTRGRWHYFGIFCLAILAITNVIALEITSPPRSTYICAAASPMVWVIPTLQYLSTILDSLMIVCVCRVLQSRSLHEKYPDNLSSGLRGLGASILIAAVLLAVISIASTFWISGDTVSVFKLSTTYLLSNLKTTLLMMILISSSIVLLQCVGHTCMLVLLTFTATMTTIITNASIKTPYRSPHEAGQAIMAVTMLAVLTSVFTFTSKGISHVSGTASEQIKNTRQAYRLLRFMSLMFICIQALMWLSNRPGTILTLSDLTSNAIVLHAEYAAKAKTSTSLQHAIEAYQLRYKRYPPPHFDAWYRYATARKSVIIDVFDELHNTLEPFYALKPAEVRARTRDLLANHWNDVAAISIRDGRAHAGSHVVPASRWMIEGVVKMINQFAEHLPDMDLAINTRDGSRVAVPFERIQHLIHETQRNDNVPGPQNQYQPGRSSHWPRIPSESIHNTVMEELNDYDNIYQYSTVGCSPSSPARNAHHWNLKSSSAMLQHDYGYAPSNWSMINDVCNQPDLQHLHGFYGSSLKATHKLYPVFSSHRMPGFNDILYPSVWDYTEKTVYAPNAQHPDLEWSNKTADLFWRGSTTEGDSFESGNWQGMLRQRLVHYANNVKNSSPPALVLQDDIAGTAHAYIMPAHEITALVPIDMQFTPDITRCRGRDCDIQRWEFAPNPNISDFQAHWSHKYLIDIDGAGASTRILPFLRSRSLPMRIGLMQEWWNERVTPWTHFVPIDIQLHSFWSTLVWFAGMNDTVNNRVIVAHDIEAQQIASAGRQWAQQSLRREDMEIYFFRLLLEWARITDDWRDEIGFTGIT